MQTNLRYHNRVSTQFSATMKTGAGLTLSGVISNISKAGLMIECSRQVIEDLIPIDSTPSLKTPIRLEVAFDLWFDNTNQQRLTSVCNIIHVRRKSRETYQVGIEFLTFPEDNYGIVEKYVELRLQAS